MGNMNEKLYTASLQLNKYYQYYHEILLQTNFSEDTKIPTMGVMITATGLKMIYNPNFINENMDEVNAFILIHEVFHFLLNHSIRTFGRNKYLENVVKDMIINNVIREDCLLVYKEYINEKINPFYIPKEYKGKLAFEYLYEWITEQMKKVKEEDEKNGKQKQKIKVTFDKNGQGKVEQNESQEGEQKDSNSENRDRENSDKENNDDKKTENNEQGEGSGNEQNSDEELSEETKEMLRKLINEEEGITIDVHFNDEVDEATKEQIIKEIIETTKARMKARGINTDNFEKTLEKLNKARKNYTKQIAKALTGITGNIKFKTWSKPNRKNLPLKGFKKYKNIINVILDTSGSMESEFEKALSYIFQNNITVNLIQIDTEVKKVEFIKSKHQLQKVRIHGLGGTTLQPAIELIKTKYNNYNNIILTDGWFDNLDFTGVKGKVLILTTDRICAVTSGLKEIKQIVISKDK